ncbi:DNA/RNA helicase domain-containing protein [Dokdonia sp. Asnod1-B02]|uniref:DNA/RNA helicase domain-containing protein n=1 Tax=Dokdonia sp. Asnod1-B02 TaxID=3160573 RepID=UPI003864EC84
MIIYNKKKIDFSSDILTNDIGNIITEHILERTGNKVSPNEVRSFQNSLGYMERVVSDNEIPNDCGISIEYHLPHTSKRVDFIITGNDGNQENVVIIELKQWENSELTSKDGIVRTRFQHGKSETSHPSYQAWSYAALLTSFNETVDEESISLYPCAYLHNYIPDTTIRNDFYNYYLEKAPVFLKPDALKLREFIKKYIKQGDTSDIMFRIDNGKIKPTKSLADSLKSMIKGNREFIMIDDQKVVYETALDLALKSHEKNKNILIVEGGPGTGKSVVAINLLVELNRRGKMTQYVTKTSAPRDVFFEKLRGQKRMTELKSLFVGSGTFINAPKNLLNTLLIDEAHRLTEKTGFLKRGDNQIKEILNSSLSSVFFIDENQRVSVSDYATIDVIEDIAKELGIKVHKLKLQSQFRCNGSDGYLAWLDNTLQIKETANYDLKSLDYDFDFKVFDTAKELQQTIYAKNKIKNKARIVAGYCWKWVSKKNPEQYDFKNEEFGFDMRWNMMDYGGKWIIEPESVTEIGCIHTSQGLEVDYIGVIIGNDLIVRNGEIITDSTARDSGDRTIFGAKSGLKKNPDYWKPLLDEVIRNTYRTLMTRGMKGCYIYCTDKETNEYFKNLL